VSNAFKDDRWVKAKHVQEDDEEWDEEEHVNGVSEKGADVFGPDRRVGPETESHNKRFRGQNDKGALTGNSLSPP
jgi:hypothetical protein